MHRGLRPIRPRELEGIQAMIDALPFYALLVDEDHIIVAANRATADALGVLPSDLLCQHCVKAVHNQDAPFEGCPLEQTLVSGEYSETEYFDSGHGRWILSSVSPTDLTKDEKRIYLHFARDITRDKRATIELSRSYEHHRAVSAILQQLQTLQSVVDVLELVLDRVLALSWIELAGAAAAFLVEDDHLEMVVHRNMDQAVVKTCSKVAKGSCLCGRAFSEARTLQSQSVGEEHLYKHHDMHDHGHVVVPLIHAGQVLGVLNFYVPEGGQLGRWQIGFLETVAHISAVTLSRLQIQAELTRADRVATRGLLASIVAHEIRTPLNALSIKVQRIGRRLRNEPEVEVTEMMDDIEGLKTEIHRINRQIEDHLLAAVRNSPTHMARIVVNDIVFESVQFMEPEASQRGAVLRCELGDQLPQVKADRKKLRQILINLILNAIQAMPGGGEVTVRTGVEDGTVVISIQDSGAGLPELSVKAADLDQVCLPFVTTKEAGTGLGLAICARLIKEMQGRITVDSSPGVGACFTVRLRATREPR